MTQVHREGRYFVADDLITNIADQKLIEDLSQSGKISGIIVPNPDRVCSYGSQDTISRLTDIPE